MKDRRRRIANVKFFFMKIWILPIPIYLYNFVISSTFQWEFVFLCILLFYCHSLLFSLIIEKRICNVVNSILNIEHCNKNFISSVPKISNKNSMINRCIYKFLKFINNKVKFIKIININSINSILSHSFTIIFLRIIFPSLNIFKIFIIVSWMEKRSWNI